MNLPKQIYHVSFWIWDKKQQKNVCKYWYTTHYKRTIKDHIGPWEERGFTVKVYECIPSWHVLTEESM